MISFIKNNLIYLFLVVIFLYKGHFINLVANINSLINKTNDYPAAEINLLKAENERLNEDIKTITNLENLKVTDYTLVHVSYRQSFSDNLFYITGRNAKKNALLINEEGLVGMVVEEKSGYSLATTLKGVKKLSIKVGESYGTITSYQNGLFIATDFSNYDKVSINDSVYTSKIGQNDNLIYVGSVAKIEEHEISKTLYIKSNVDFNNLNFLLLVG